MKAVIKGLIIGGVIAVIGVAIILITLATNGWAVTDMLYDRMEYTSESDINSLDIKLSAGTVRTEFYDGNEIYISYPISKNYTFEISENAGTLTVRNSQKLFWFNFSKIPETVIKLPESIKPDVNCEINAGSVNLADGVYGKVTLKLNAGSFRSGSLQCEELNCNVNAGSLNIDGTVCESLTCEVNAGSITIDKISCPSSQVKVSAGSANLGFTDSKEQFTILTSVSAGSCNVGSQMGSSGKSINVRVSAGSCNLSFGV